MAKKKNITKYESLLKVIKDSVASDKNTVFDVGKLLYELCYEREVLEDGTRVYIFTRHRPIGKVDAFRSRDELYVDVERNTGKTVPDLKRCVKVYKEFRVHTDLYEKIVSFPAANDIADLKRLIQTYNLRLANKKDNVDWKKYTFEKITIGDMSAKLCEIHSAKTRRAVIKYIKESTGITTQMIDDCPKVIQQLETVINAVMKHILANNINSDEANKANQMLKDASSMIEGYMSSNNITIAEEEQETEAKV